MKRIMAIELVNGTVLTEEVPQEADGLTDEEVLEKLAKVLDRKVENGHYYGLYANQLFAIDKVVEAYIQES